jgi:alkanesulfonate monooxygenase SsuD/methylene tetrahydromethanopterin reductase-like flavin-dependent oxidoreductase (luciferase family)
MQFGVFDQNDLGTLPLADQYENRLRLIEFYDRSGFRTYHMSEHHSTPLSMTPSPSVFLAAVAQRTQRIRLGPLVYVLPMHHPLRLAEEICMLDHLSRGRFEWGVGRGASPHELEDFGVDSEKAPARYVETYNVIKQALTQTQVNFQGGFHHFRNAPFEIKPLQRPYPPIWYVVPLADGAAWPAREGINIVCGGPVANAREISERYRAERAHAGHPEGAEPLIGLNRFVLIADSDAEAMDLGRRAWPRFQASFMKLWKKHGTQPRFIRLPEDFDAVVDAGFALAGGPATVREQVGVVVEAAGANYFIAQFSFGDLAHEQVLRSAGLFVEHVMTGSGDALRPGNLKL